MFPTNSERLIGLSDAFPAFVYGYPSSCPRAHCTPNKSVPTLRYTRRPGPIYTGRAGRHLPSAVPWISEDRLLLFQLPCLVRFTRTMSTALLLRNNSKRKKSNFRSPAPPPYSCSGLTWRSSSTSSSRSLDLLISPGTLYECLFRFSSFLYSRLLQPTKSRGDPSTHVHCPSASLSVAPSQNGLLSTLLHGNTWTFTKLPNCWT